MPPGAPGRRSAGWRDPGEKQLCGPSWAPPAGGIREDMDSVYPPEKQAPTCCLSGTLKGEGANRKAVQGGRPVVCLSEEKLGPGSARGKGLKPCPWQPREAR